MGAAAISKGSAAYRYGMSSEPTTMIDSTIKATTADLLRTNMRAASRQGLS